MADVAINSDSADIPAVNLAQQGSDPTAPGVSRWLLFFKSTGAWAITNAASAFRLAKHVMTAAGDLTVGGASGVETRLPMGSALQHLRVNAGATALEYADPPAAAYIQGCRLRKSTDTSINNGASTAIAFDVEDYDTDGMHEGVTNPTRATCQTNGKYLIHGKALWKTGTFAGPFVMYLKLNNTTNIAQSYIDAQGGAGFLTQETFTLYSLVATDYIELICENYEGETHNVQGNDPASPVLELQRVG